MENVEQRIHDILFDKVTVFDKNGNQNIIEAFRIIIELNGKEYCIENHPHTQKPDGITVYADVSHENTAKHIAVYPAAGNAVHLSIYSSDEVMR